MVGMSLTVRKVAAYAPAVALSTAVTVLVGALLPAVAAWALFVGGLAVTATLLTGRGESVAVRLLWRAREPTAAERAALVPAAASLAERGVVVGGLRLLVRAGEAPSAEGVGRGTLVVSAGLVAAVRQRRLPVGESAAVLAHGVGVVRSGVVRCDPVLAFWTLPSQLLRGVSAGVGRVGRSLPLVGAVWACRFIVAGIAVIQVSAAGQWLVGGVVAVVAAVSYLAPVGERTWADRMREIGDMHVRRAGLARQLSSFLLREARSPQVFERVHLLSQPGAPDPAVPLSPIPCRVVGSTAVTR